MAIELPEPQSRMEELLHQQIKLQEETNQLLRDIKAQVPHWPSMKDFIEIVRKGSE